MRSELTIEISNDCRFCHKLKDQMIAARRREAALREALIEIRDESRQADTNEMRIQRIALDALAGSEYSDDKA